MTYSKEQVKEIFDEICRRIEEGESLRSVLRDEDMPSSRTFFKWIDEDEEKVKQYARATELRAEAMFEEMFEISNHTNEDHTPFTGKNVVMRDRLRVDTIKWALSKMNPKKYGEKLDVTTDGEKIKSDFYFTSDDFSEED